MALRRDVVICWPLARKADGFFLTRCSGVSFLDREVVASYRYTYIYILLYLLHREVNGLSLGRPTCQDDVQPTCL